MPLLLKERQTSISIFYDLVSKNVTHFSSRSIDQCSPKISRSLYPEAFNMRIQELFFKYKNGKNKKINARTFFYKIAIIPVYLNFSSKFAQAPVFLTFKQSFFSTKENTI